MHPSRCVATACVALLLSVVSAGPASSLPAPKASEAPLAGTCSSGKFCTWTDKDYYGTKYTIPDYGNGTCMTGDGYKARSYINNSGIQGYFYANPGCTGQSRGIARGRNANLGFTAQSFRFACVTC